MIIDTPVTLLDEAQPFFKVKSTYAQPAPRRGHFSFIQGMICFYLLEFPLLRISPCHHFFSLQSNLIGFTVLCDVGWVHSNVTEFTVVQLVPDLLTSSSTPKLALEAVDNKG